jgi:hypothetical protein
MREFCPIVLPVLEAVGARHLCEIGAEHGGMTMVLADWSRANEGKLVTIDPSPSEEMRAWLAAQDEVVHKDAPSLEAIGEVSGVDAWFIDGDHNWYTVYNELKLIRQACRRDRKPMLVFLHDVSWPCARRDAYYAPDRIPAEFRHPFSYEGGVTLDSAGLLPNQGFRGMGSFAWAIEEGGPRNGVLTAVEDFVGETLPDGEQWAWAYVPAVFGLGVLYDLSASWAPQVSALLSSWHANELLATLEENRLRNYLRVIEMQDFGLNPF